MTDNIHSLSGAYAVDALDDIERAQFERHLAQCATCRSEVDSLREAGSLMAETSAATPTDDLRRRVLHDIATVRPLAPLVATVTPIRSGRRWLNGLVAAAAVIAVVGGGTVVWHPWTDGSSQSPSLSAADQVLQATDVKHWTKKFPDGSEATLYRSRQLNKAVVVTKNMAAPPDGKAYELWLQDAEDGMVPAGLLTAGVDTLVLSGDAANAVGAGITIEPAAGSHVPTTETIALFTFENA